MKKCIALLTNIPNIIWIEFLNNFINYDIFFIINSNNINYSEIYSKKYNKINFIQINNNVCLTKGYINSTYDEKISSFDKALYYFIELNNNYDYVWFINENCFFNSEETLLKLENKYQNEDLLIIKPIKTQIGIFNKKIRGIIFPYYLSLFFCNRLSKNILSEIKNYLIENLVLNNADILITNLAIKNNYLVENPEEFINNYENLINNLNIDYIYNNFNDINLHKIIRDK